MTVEVRSVWQWIISKILSEVLHDSVTCNNRWLGSVSQRLFPVLQSSIAIHLNVSRQLSSVRNHCYSLITVFFWFHNDKWFKNSKCLPKQEHPSLSTSEVRTRQGRKCVSYSVGEKRAPKQGVALPYPSFLPQNNSRPSFHSGNPRLMAAKAVPQQSSWEQVA